MSKRSVTCPSCGQNFVCEGSQDNKQLEEIVRIKKPLLIQAGPGTGKTHALAYKIKHLVKNESIPKDSITVITFTNEAATNMRKKISEKGDESSPYLEPEKQPSAICTVHKFCHKLLNQYASMIGRRPGIRVINSQELRNILVQDAAQLVPGGTRDEGLVTIKCREQGECAEEDSLKCKICSRYRKLLEAKNYVDFDDQVLLACKLLKNNDSILRNVQNRARYLLVDEYQDINNAQWELIKLLSKGYRDNLFVVGDEYQSIYGFRGGHPKFIRKFKDDYGPEAVEEALLTSWRCPPDIFKGAFSMVQHYCGGDIGILDRIEFKNTSTAKIRIKEFDQQNQEADFLAQQIMNLGPSPDVLILIPWLGYAEPIKRQLNKYHINFSCDYDVEETDLHIVNTLLEWLKEPTNDFDLRLLIEEIIGRGVAEIPTRKKEDAYRQISQYWDELKERRTLYLRVKSFTQSELQKLRNIVLELRKTYDPKMESAPFLSAIVEKLDVWGHQSAFAKEMQSIYDEVKNLLSSGDKGVRIMTMKKAKGLEADCVFIIGAESNFMASAIASKTQKEEDSRLLYVSMTRAKKELYIYNSTQRRRDITKTKHALIERSELIEAIPKQYVIDMDHSY